MSSVPQNEQSYPRYRLLKTLQPQSPSANVQNYGGETRRHIVLFTTHAIKNKFCYRLEVVSISDKTCPDDNPNFDRTLGLQVYK